QGGNAMRISYTRSIVAMLSFLGAANVQAQDSDIESLRLAVAELRADYEARISELEQRLAVAEQNARQANASSQPTSTGTAQSAFNPAIGVIFSGTAWTFSEEPEGNAIAGFPYGGEAGLATEGFSLGETEINISANVDDKFTAWLTLPVAIEDGEAVVEVEEAWLETTALPAGLSLRFGRFFSGIGYLNGKHLHSWDFADQPLPYQVFLGDQYIDDGAQLRWIAPTATYLEFGAELLRGDRFPSAGAAHSGIGGHSLFMNVGGDFGSDHSWLAGLSLLDVTAIDRPSGDEDAPIEFTGDALVTSAHFVWKWAPNGNWRERNFVLQSELMWSSEDGFYTLPGDVPIAYDADQFGWYVQAVYQPFPRWRFGGRVDGLSADNPGTAFAGSLLDPGTDDPRRYTLMADWSNSEFSRFRLQFVRDEASLMHGQQLGIQYIHSIGAHGGHSF
ncbi:MAG: hypothetical protein RIA65_08240, partial [Woeseia sp.]